MPYPVQRSEYTAHNSTGPILWVLASRIDCDAMDLWCGKHLRRDAETTAELDAGLERCQRLRPGLLILDPAVGDASIARAVIAVKNRSTGHLLVLDRRPREGVLVEVLAEPAVSYLSRMISSDDLAAAIRAILDHGMRAIDPTLMPRLKRTERGFEFRGSPHAGSIAGLSARERQVMQLLAQGKTVRQCAAALGLAHSTIDNHKARLMKKLGVHKASQLTCHAVREGLIAL